MVRLSGARSPLRAAPASIGIRCLRSPLLRCLVCGFATSLTLTMATGAAQASSGVTPASTAAASSDPFASNDGAVPPKSAYDGPLFTLSHDYPATPKSPQPMPWREAIHDGPITIHNAEAYVQALKDYVGPDMRVLLGDYAHWDAAARGWYNEPWLGSLRESIHGTYVGTDDFPKDQFAGTGLTEDFSTYVLTYYDHTAAVPLAKVWGGTAMTPTIDTKANQFPEGGVVIKVALTTANADVWPVMQGTLEWPLYITVNATTGNHAKPEVDKTSLMQFDLIVKDTQSAPRTGWVFATLVYDKDAPGTDVWDKMVPLGAMWGNDPKVNSTKHPKAKLKQTWINPKAPAYATKTLGWGGRLSGPNDGAVNDAAFEAKGGLEKIKNLPSSSCMSCHGVAEWPMQSFLLPATTMPPTIIDDDYILMPQPGKRDWRRWFQSRAGDEPQDSLATAFDYDMVFVFKSLPAWQTATGNGTTLLDGLQRNGRPVTELQYRGLPFQGE